MFIDASKVAKSDIHAKPQARDHKKLIVIVCVGFVVIVVYCVNSMNHAVKISKIEKTNPDFPDMSEIMRKPAQGQANPDNVTKPLETRRVTQRQSNPDFPDMSEIMRKPAAQLSENEAINTKRQILQVMEICDLRILQAKKHLETLMKSQSDLSRQLKLHTDAIDILQHEHKTLTDQQSSCMHGITVANNSITALNNPTAIARRLGLKQLEKLAEEKIATYIQKISALEQKKNDIDQLLKNKTEEMNKLNKAILELKRQEEELLMLIQEQQNIIAQNQKTYNELNNYFNELDYF